MKAMQGKDSGRRLRGALLVTMAASGAIGLASCGGSNDNNPTIC